MEKWHTNYNLVPMPATRHSFILPTPGPLFHEHCSTLSCCRVLLPAPPFAGDNLIVTASPCWQANLEGRSRALESRPTALFLSVRSADPDWDTSATRCFLYFMGREPNGQRGRAGGRGPPGKGWEMTDGPMEWCQAGWSDSWNRLSISDWPEKDEPVRRLSYRLHYQEEQLPAATGEKHHAMDWVGVERQSWTTNELKGQWSGDPSQWMVILECIYGLRFGP